MNSIITLKKDKLSAKISTLGAQLLSFCDEKNEYMWQADPNVWGFTAPVVFPICGRVKDEQYTFEGKTYTMQQHGFARFKEFEAEKISDDSACFLLRGDEETKKSYPFDFEFRVIFTLGEDRLSTTYSVTNPSDKNIYFSFGGHEGYACDNRADDCYVEFENDSKLTRLMLTDGFLNGETKEISLENNKLMVDYKEFEKCNYLFRDINSDSVIFSTKDDSRRIRIGFEGHNALAIWTVPERKYLCIEPWCGIPQSAEFDGDFNEKDSIICLEPKKTFERTHYVQIL